LLRPLSRTPKYICFGTLSAQLPPGVPPLLQNIKFPQPQLFQYKNITVDRSQSKLWMWLKMIQFYKVLVGFLEGGTPGDSLSDNPAKLLINFENKGFGRNLTN
jgi:hypothetical protein